MNSNLHSEYSESTKTPAEERASVRWNRSLQKRKKYRRHGPSPARLVIAIAGYGLYFGANLVFLFLLPMILLLSFKPKLLYRAIKFIYRLFLRFLTRTYLPFLRIYRIREESGFETVPADRPVIFVVNHRSRIDGPMILGTIDNTGVVMKSSYAKLPVFSSFVKYCDSISVDPHSIESLSSAMLRCKQLIARGSRIVIFPEGARARSARLQQFKDMAFRLAIETGAAIVPVLLHSDYPFMAKISGSTVPPVCMDFRIRALAPMYMIPDERASDFASRVRRRMAEELKSLDRGTIWEKLTQVPLPAASSRARSSTLESC